MRIAFRARDRYAFPRLGDLFVQPGALLAPLGHLLFDRALPRHDALARFIGSVGLILDRVQDFEAGCQGLLRRLDRALECLDVDFALGGHLLRLFGEGRLHLLVFGRGVLVGNF